MKTYSEQFIPKSNALKMKSTWINQFEKNWDQSQYFLHEMFLLKHRIMQLQLPLYSSDLALGNFLSFWNWKLFFWVRNLKMWRIFKGIWYWDFTSHERNIRGALTNGKLIGMNVLNNRRLFHRKLMFHSLYTSELVQLQSVRYFYIN